jgi:nickel-type superoxide dismutase maturation protease
VKYQLTLATRAQRPGRPLPTGAAVTPSGAAILVVVIATVLGVGMLAVLRPRRVVVEGESMQPTLAPGDRLLVARTGRVRPGDVVALRDPRDVTRLLVKRVTSTVGSKLVVHGDNEEASTDSRAFGPVEERYLVGKVVRRYGPVTRAGLVR